MHVKVSGACLVRVLQTNAPDKPNDFAHFRALALTIVTPGHNPAPNNISLLINRFRHSFLLTGRCFTVLNIDGVCKFPFGKCPLTLDDESGIVNLRV